MPDKPAEWVWILKCHCCSRVVDFDDVHVPTMRLAEWAWCSRPESGKYGR